MIETEPPASALSPDLDATLIDQPPATNDLPRAFAEIDPSKPSFGDSTSAEQPTTGAPEQHLVFSWTERESVNGGPRRAVRHVFTGTRTDYKAHRDMNANS